jgi:Protein of unknown function (DUF2955)
MNPLKNSLHRQRIFRFAFGTSVSILLAFGLGWVLSMITPIFVGIFLSSKNPCPDLKAGFMVVAVILIAFVLGFLVSIATFRYPVVAIVAISYLLFAIYWLQWRLDNPFLPLMLTLSIVMCPLLTMQSPALTLVFVLGFSLNGMLAIFAVWVSFLLFPDPKNTVYEKTATAATISEPREQVWQALLSTMIVLPALLFFLHFNLASDILILAFIAILAQQIDLKAGIMGGIALLLANMVGGIIAIIVYNLLVAVPDLMMLAGLSCLICLLFAQGLFSTSKYASLCGSAYSAFVVLLAISTLSEGSPLDQRFILRIFQIAVAVVYIIGAFALCQALCKMNLAEKTN